MSVLSKYLRLLSGSLLAAALALPPVQAGESVLPVVQVLHNDFVSTEKFQRLQQPAADAGLALRHLNVDKSTPEVLRQAVADAALVVLDVPRPDDRSRVEQSLAQAALDLARPRLIVGGGRPAWEHIVPHHAAVLAAHYAAGGEEGFRRFFALAKSVHEGAIPSPDLLESTPRLPSTGFYHPQAPQIFTRLNDYLDWQAERSQNRLSTGRVAFLTHPGPVADMLTRDLDELIARTEAAGLTPVVFWFDAAAPEGLAGVLGSGEIDALVNLGHMQNGAARSRDFLTLDVPVIQTLRFREGEAAEWPAAISGVSARTTAVFLAGPEGWGLSDPVVLSARTDGVEDVLPEQADALIGKLKSLVALRHTPAAEKKLGLMFWNYPAGEKNLGASNLNIPRSILSIRRALADQGYDSGQAVTEEQVIAAAQRMLGALFWMCCWPKT